MKELGYDFSSIGGTVDTQAIINAIKNQTEKSVEQEQKAADPVAEEVDKFYGTFPDAKLHDAFLAAVIEANPQASLSESYTVLKTSAIEQGYDWSKPLGPQIDAKKATEQKEPPKKEDKPIINGRHVGSDNAEDHSKGKAAVQGETWEDIIRGGMKDGGLNIQ